MTERTPFFRGFIAGVLLSIGSGALGWLMFDRFGASRGQLIFTGVAAALYTGAAVWMLVREQRRRAQTPQR